MQQSVQRTVVGLLLTALASLWVGALAAQAEAPEVSGNATLEIRLFPQTTAYPGQRSQSVSLSFEPEYYQPFGSHSLIITPFIRADSADGRRNHFDLREAYFLYVAERFELAIGLRKVFWGVTESQHLVDIINQTDLVENPDTEDKLGQPMVHLLLPSDYGTVELFALPYFRERTYPGRRGRLRGPLPVDPDRTTYAAGAEQYHLDLAARYSHTLGPWDVGLSHFSGTSREPNLTPTAGGTVLAARYPLIQQSGLDLQLTWEQWLFKAEAIHRTGQGPGYYAWTGGFEYTLVGLFGSNMDLGLLGEWLRDSRGRSARTPFQQDILGGMRLVWNDAEDTQALIGGITDPRYGTLSVFIEASRRVATSTILSLELRLSDAPADDPIFNAVDQDDFFQLSLARYF